MDRDLIKVLLTLPSGNLCDANGKYGAMDHGIKPLSLNFKMAGTALTVSCPSRDNWTIHAAIEAAQPGDILVVNAGSYCNAGHFGEIMATASMKKGIAGLVIDGGVRDILDLIRMNFPVFCRGVSPNGTVKATLGKVNVPIQCGGVVVNPGDLVFGDADGVVVISKDEIGDVVHRAKSVNDNELKTKERIEQGHSTLEILGLKSK